MAFSSSSSASWSSPCAACKFLRRKCTAECVFAPYFPPDQPQKFANVHKIFGASNITKLLNELPLHQREDAVNSLAYEADARVKDPVYGCVGVISILQRQASRLQQQLSLARTELSRFSSPPPPSLMDPIGGSFGTMQQHNTLMIDLMQLTAREQQQLMQIQRETHNEITREQLLNHLSASRVANNSSLYAEVGHFGLASFSSSSIRHGGDGGSTSSGGGSSLGHLSPP